jgi:Glycosyl hydrolase family 71.
MTLAMLTLMLLALNIAKDEDTNESSLGNALLAAQNVGFYLFFSFDYAGKGAWDRTKWSAISSPTMRIAHKLLVPQF